MEVFILNILNLLVSQNVIMACTVISPNLLIIFQNTKPRFSFPRISRYAAYSFIRFGESQIE